MPRWEYAQLVSGIGRSRSEEVILYTLTAQGRTERKFRSGEFDIAAAQLGAEGWELVATEYPSSPGYFWIFKRLLP